MVPPAGISGATALITATLPTRLVPNSCFQSCLVSSSTGLNGELAALSTRWSMRSRPSRRRLLIICSTSRLSEMSASAL